jgi:hypothetical protein
MNTTIKNLLENGIKGLANLEEDYFKENITHAIAFKLNESMKEVYEDSLKNLFYREENTNPTTEILEFIDFVQNFREGKYKFKNNSVLNINESQMQSLKELFDFLSPKNRETMAKEIFEDSNNFKGHLEFYNQVKGLIK